MKYVAWAAVPAVCVGTASAQYVFPLVQPNGTLQATAELNAMGSNQATPISLPGPGSVHADMGPHTVCDASYAFTSGAASAGFESGLFQRTAYPLDGGRAIVFGDIRLRPLEAAAYDIGGSYEVLASAGSAVLFMEVMLFELGGSVVFKHQAFRNVSTGSSITVGVAASGDLLEGSPTGQLAPNVSYMLAWQWRLEGAWTNGAEEAAGHLSVVVSPIPSPGGCGLLAIAGTIVASRRRR